MILELLCDSQKVVGGLRYKISVNFSGVQMNDKILRMSSPAFLSLFLFPHKSEMKRHAVLDRLAQCISV